MITANHLAIQLFKLSYDWIVRHRYYILIVFLFFRFVAFASNGFWSGDFWEHSASIRELMERPSHPQHPILLLEMAHPFFSPYSYCAAIVARLLSISAVDILTLLGLTNFLLLAFGLKRFCSVISPIPSQITAFYSLIFTLLLWGSNPWPYSGFFHFEIIESVLPYPSTFCAALSLIGLSIFLQPLKINWIFNFLILIIIICFVLLSHPLTFIFLASGLFFLSFYNLDSLFSKPFFAFVLIILSCIFCLFWPYFSLQKLLFGGSDIYHLSNAVMYLKILNRIWPNFLLFPALYLAFKSGLTKSILFWFITLCLIYAWGFITSNFSYGRIISFCILLLHITAAIGLAQFESNIEKSNRLFCNIYRTLLIIILLTLTLISITPIANRLITITHQVIKHQVINNQVTYKNIVFIKNYVHSDQLVLSDTQTSWIIPTFGGKVIAALHPQAFVSDSTNRQHDIDLFFNLKTTKDQRIEILNKYHPKFLLLDLNHPSSALIEKNLSEFINPLAGNTQYRLFSIQII